MAAHAAILAFNGDKVKALDAGIYADVKAAFDKLVESGGGGYSKLELIDSRVGRVRRKKFDSPSPAESESPARQRRSQS